MEVATWQILYHDWGGWSWRCVDPSGEVHESRVSFATWAACVADAKLHGYPDKECRSRQA